MRPLYPSQTPEARRAYRATPQWKARHASQKLMAKYGVTVCEYTRMRIEQGDVCAICNEPDPKRSLSVDHCHDTGKVRGLLCTKCNVGIGALRDSPEMLRSALSYLLR